ncbi:MAG: hypothetical protein CK424_00180 [Legionella sp.]|nr:MAG: hypothetical protein CK424_00180 [Legionella sp.]
MKKRKKYFVPFHEVTLTRSAQREHNSKHLITFYQDRDQTSKRYIFSKSEPKPDSLILTMDVFVARVDSETARTSIDKLKNDETFR